MNWMKAVIAGVVGGIAVNLYSWLMHGIIMSATYTKYDTVFTQGDGSPLPFFAIAITVGIAGGILFAKTRSSWAEGLMGGATFGFYLGLVSFFSQFYNALVIADFPYYLSWCWGGISLGGWVLFGVVASLLYKE